MTPREIEKKVLWAGIEDWYGLWEPIWQLRTLDPTLSRPDAEELVKTAIRSLLAKGWIELWDRYTTGGDERLIPSGEIESVLSDPGSWADPPEGSFDPGEGPRMVLFAATDSGEVAYRRGEYEA